jgi:GTP-binding protein HflX
VDSRLVKRRIQQLQGQLRELAQSRLLQRRFRRKRAIPVAAIVGYTNAGKSCLFNRLTEAGVLVADKLFATLDPTLRRLRLPNNQELLLTDTVGFVRKLPHQLVEAFKSTLEEAASADFLLEVLDITSAAAEIHHATTCAVLKEIGADRLPVITVYNKIDLLPESDAWRRTRRRAGDASFVSAQTGEGLDALRDRLAAQLAHTRRELCLRLPPSRYDLLALLHRHGQVQQLAYAADAIHVTATLPLPLCPQFEPYLDDAPPPEPPETG